MFLSKDCVGSFVSFERAIIVLIIPNLAVSDCRGFIRVSISPTESLSVSFNFFNKIWLLNL